MRHSRRLSGKRCGVLALLVVLATAASGEDVPGQAGRGDASGTTATGARRFNELKEAAQTYRITLGTDPPKRLALCAEPLLRWTNPLRKTNEGAVFLWVADGRPEAVASFYRFKYERSIQEEHEFQSLALTGLTATRDGRDVWFARQAGVNLVPIPDAPVPAGTPAERLRQLRALASQFRAFFDSPTDQAELRLLARPLYRYETHRADLVDGALFAFVQATDPEVLLLIEDRPHNGALAWQYGLARMSMVNLRAELKRQVVWRAEWDNDRFAPDKPYMTLRASEVPADDEPAAIAKDR